MTDADYTRRWFAINRALLAALRHPWGRRIEHRLYLAAVEQHLTPPYVISRDREIIALPEHWRVPDEYRPPFDWIVWAGSAWEWPDAD